MKFAVLSAVVTLLAGSSVQAQDDYFRGPLQIGEPSPFTVVASAGKARQDVIESFGSSFISVHFAKFDLPQGDYVVVRSPDNEYSYKYTGLGRGDQGLKPNGFHSSSIPGDSVIVEYHTADQNVAATSTKGYVIDSFFKSIDNEVQSVCGTDNSRPAKCYLNGTQPLPQAYQKAKAVVRLTMGGGLCTGWLVGSEGHLVTNNHCVGGPDEATQIDVEAMAESGSCKEECQVQLGCKGKKIATTTTFVATNQDLDYTILKLPEGTDTKDYGYLTLRSSGAVAKEQIYIPQHPRGYAKRIATVVDDGTPAVISTVTASNSCGKDQVGYMADTAPGASGSPVLSAVDNTVVALHHCGGCDNTGINSAKLVQDWIAQKVTIKDAVV